VLNAIAERYVRLVLRIGQHDRDYVDAYYGNPAWRPTAAPIAIKDLLAEARDIRDTLVDLTLTDIVDEMTSLQLSTSSARPRRPKTARDARIARSSTSSQRSVRRGRASSFDRAFQAALDELGASCRDMVRWSTSTPHRQRFVILFRLDDVFRTTIEVCRSRARASGSSARRGVLY
jgi:hypothetical protein